MPSYTRQKFRLESGGQTSDWGGRGSPDSSLYNSSWVKSGWSLRSVVSREEGDGERGALIEHFLSLTHWLAPPSSCSVAPRASQFAARYASVAARRPLPQPASPSVRPSSR